MDIEIKKTVNEEVKVKYFCVDAVPRYWEDGDYNGKEDIPWEEQENGAKPMMPLAVENDDPKKNRDESYKLVFKIDLETGVIPEWPKGNTAAIHYKVCDQGVYWLEDVDGNEIHKIESYCPKILEVGDSYPDGDYFIFHIDENGKIAEWPEEWKVKGLIADFLKDEGF